MRSGLVNCLIGLVLLSVFSSIAHAEDRTPTTIPTEPERKHAKRLEHVGEWLTGFSLAHVVAGAPVLAIGVRDSSIPHGDAYSVLPGVYEFTGSMMIGVGAGLLVAGVPLWIVGHVRNRGVDRMPAAAFMPSRLTLRF
jgi:hypothetical protein